MRIIIDGEVIVMAHFSGIGHYTLELLRAIDRQLDNDNSLSVSLLIYYRHIEKARSFGFRNIKLIRSPFSLRVSNGLKNHNIRLPLDIFFGRGIYIFPNYSSWALLFSKSIPFIYDISYEKYPELVEPKNQIFLSKQVKGSANRANMVATISESSKQDISDFYYISKKLVKVFYPAVNRGVFFHKSPKDIAKVKNKYNIKDNYILFVGNIEPRKNLSNLLLAYEKLPHEAQTKHPLLIVGAKGWQDKEIFNIITRIQRKHGSVQFPSQYVIDKDLPAIYSGAKLFIYPSIYEGFGIPPIEAMACGVPVISANNSSLPEAVGDATLLVDALSVEDISSSITRLLSDKALQKQLIKQGYKQVSKFSWDESAKNFLNSLRSLKR